MMFGLTPIVVQSRVPSVADSNTRVVDVFAGLHLQLRAQLRGDTQGESLVGTLFAEPRSVRLEALDLAGPVWRPRVRHVIG